ncbi:hypothetical protein BOX15_Mlig030209g1 [Macrostomum lignano]|uniref:Phospholipid scramblase n=2 Tax=Macrostomum lignano TaxID=282301 RepID=A0A267ESX1_9PLAT|nr:hypothetical protein BOX15_Mlig030209g1 [Macrostomum lignano]
MAMAINSVGPAPSIAVHHLPILPVSDDETTWAKPLPVPGIHRQPAMEPLLSLDTMLLQQKKDVISALTGVPLPNSYSLKASNGEQIFYMEEKSPGYQRGGLCRPQSGFSISATDSAGQEVALFVRRDRACKSACCCPCCNSCLDHVTVESPPGHVVGRVRQAADLAGCNRVSYQLTDAAGGAIFRVDDMKLVYCCINGKSLEFPVTPVDDGTGQPVARISKQFHANALNQLRVSGADTFTVTMPVDLHLNMKLSLIGVCLLLDFMLFDTATAQGVPPTQSLYVPGRPAARVHQDVVLHM